MSVSRTNPHIDQPTEDDLQSLVEDKSPVIQELYLHTHRLVLETAPDVQCSVDCNDAVIGYGARQYGYDGWGMGALGPHTKWVSLHFFKGTSLNDPEGILEGTGKSLRHVKLRSLEELATRRNAIVRLLQQSVNFHGA